MVSRPSRIVKKKRNGPDRPAATTGREGWLIDQVCRIRNLLQDRGDERPYAELYRKLDDLIGELEPVPTVAALQAARAEFFAISPEERSEVFNGWETATPELPAEMPGDTFQRLLCIEAVPEHRHVIAHVEYRVRENTCAVEVLIMEGTPFVEALAGIEIARDTILRQWRQLINSADAGLLYV